MLENERGEFLDEKRMRHFDYEIDVTETESDYCFQCIQCSQVLIKPNLRCCPSKLSKGSTSSPSTTLRFHTRTTVKSEERAESSVWRNLPGDEEAFEFCERKLHEKWNSHQDVRFPGYRLELGPFLRTNELIKKFNNKRLFDTDAVAN